MDKHRNRNTDKVIFKGRSEPKKEKEMFKQFSKDCRETKLLAGKKSLLCNAKKLLEISFQNVCCQCIIFYYYNYLVSQKYFSIVLV